MSESSLELVKRIYGFNWASLGSRREGMSVGLDVFAPDFEYQLDPAQFKGRVLEGAAGIENFLQAIEEDFRDFRQRADRFIDAGEVEGGERVIVLGQAIGHGRRSGVPFSSPFGHIWTVRDGKAVRLEGYLDQELALAVAGLKEETESQEA
jgi:ketosteroid isomerase-like protein